MAYIGGYVSLPRSAPMTQGQPPSFQQPGVAQPVADGIPFFGKKPRPIDGTGALTQSFLNYVWTFLISRGARYRTFHDL